MFCKLPICYSANGGALMIFFIQLIKRLTCSSARIFRLAVADKIYSLFYSCLISGLIQVSTLHKCKIIQESPAIADKPARCKACQKLLQFDVLTTLSLTILAHLHSFSCCCVRNLRNPAKVTENSNSWSSRSSKVIDIGVNQKPMYDFLLVTNSNFGRICYRFRDIDA